MAAFISSSVWRSLQRVFSSLVRPKKAMAKGPANQDVHRICKFRSPIAAIYPPVVVTSASKRPVHSDRVSNLRLATLSSCMPSCLACTLPSVQDAQPNAT